MRRAPAPLTTLAEGQAGVLSRSQLAAHGTTDASILANLKARRWQRVYRGVFATFTGPLPERSRLWAALLWAGEGAALGDVTALREYGFVTTESDPLIQVRVDHDRRVIVPPGIELKRRRRLDEFVHPVRVPRVLRVDDAALHAASSRPRLVDGFGLLADVCAQRLTTPRRLRDALVGLPKLRSRKALWSVLDDIASGAHSFLELSYLERVERAHRLPTPRRQAADSVVGRRVWRDAEYDDWGVILELDGRLGHDESAGRAGDRRRDLIAASRGRCTIRNGYVEVTELACDTAALVASVLTARGWPGWPVGCGDSCDIGARMASFRLAG